MPIRSPLEVLKDLWFVNIKGLHKHNYVTFHGNNVHGVTYSSRECIGCEKVIGLADYQIRSLPNSMLYVPKPNSVMYEDISNN